MSPRLTDARGEGRGRWARWRRTPHAVALWPAPQDASGGLQDEHAHGPALQRWRDWCMAHAGASVQLLLSCRWSLQWVVEVSAADGAEQAWAAAREQAAHYLGATFMPAEWAWRAWPVLAQSASPPTRARWLVVAMPRTLLADVRAVADAAGVRLVRVGPWWADWLEADADHDAGADAHVDGRSADSALTLHDAGWQLTWGQAQLQCMPMAPASPERAGEPAPRGRSVQGPQGPEGLQEGPFDWSPASARAWRLWRQSPRASVALDFTRRVRPMARWSWALPVLGAVALIVGLVQGHALDTRIEALLLQQQRLLKAEHRLRVQRAQTSQPPLAPQALHDQPITSAGWASMPDSTALAPWSPAQQLAAQAVMTRLSWPWLQGLALSTEGVRAGRARWSQWQFDLGELRRPATDVPLITLAAWVTQDEALAGWMGQAPQPRWVSRELLRDPLPGAQGLLTVKGQWQKPWPEAAP